MPLPYLGNRHKAKKHKPCFDASGTQGNLELMLSPAQPTSPLTCVHKMESLKEKKHNLKNVLAAPSSSDLWPPVFPVSCGENLDYMAQIQLGLGPQPSYQKLSGAVHDKENLSKTYLANLGLGSESTMRSGHTECSSNHATWLSLTLGQSNFSHDSAHHSANPSQFETYVDNVHLPILPQTVAYGENGSTSSPSALNQLSGAFDGTGKHLSQMSMEISNEGEQTFCGSRNSKQHELEESPGKSKPSQPLLKSQITSNQRRVVELPCTRDMDNGFCKHISSASLCCAYISEEDD